MEKIREISANIRKRIPKQLARRHSPVVPEDYPTDWKSIYIATLLSVLSMFQTSCLNPTIWPYMQRIVPTSTQSQYSLMVSLTHASNAIFSIIFGFLSNYFATTTFALIFSKCAILLGSAIYFFIEVFVDARMFLFFMTELLFGISGGAGSVAKTQIVMASTEIERPKAMGIIQVGGFVGMVIGPMLQIAFMGLGYPGADFIFGTRLNLYTVPILLTFGVSIIGIILLIFFFDGKMRIRKKEVLFEKVSTISSDGSKDNLEISNESESTFNTNDQHIGYDKIAAIICIITSTLVGVMMLVLSTVLPPFAMMVFNWTSEDMILYQAIGMILVGICMFVVIGCYVFFKLGQRVAPRNGIIFSLVIFFLFYLLTYPWPFSGANIPYKHPRGVDPANFTCADLSSINSSVELVGCPCEYTWCATTPPINMIVYFVASCLALGIAIPVMQINLDTLYSKILGPIKQGTMQGVYNAANICVQIIAPIIIAQVYAASGIVYIWIFFMIVIGIICLVWLVFYRRMISYKDRIENTKNVEAKRCFKINFRRGRINITTSHNLN